MDKQLLLSAFAERFGQGGTVYASPGRINLIGEHTDYNGGFVFPGAVQQGIMAVIRPNGTDTVRAYSMDLKDYGGCTRTFARHSARNIIIRNGRYIFKIIRNKKRKKDILQTL